MLYTDGFVLYVLFCNLLFHWTILSMSAHVALHHFKWLHCNPLGRYTKIHLINPLLLDIYAAFNFFPTIFTVVNNVGHMVCALEELTVEEFGRGLPLLEFIANVIVSVVFNDNLIIKSLSLSINFAPDTMPRTSHLYICHLILTTLWGWDY